MSASDANKDSQQRTLEEYDDLVYPSGVYYFTHPDRLAVTAALNGFEPASVSECRVLELGCSDGGNLHAMASILPNAEFVGVDLSPKQIEIANAAKNDQSLDNLQFLAKSFTDIGDELGKFDYIIAHGLFSWIPQPLQDELLSACSRLMSEKGLAYISYNVEPGANEKMWLRQKLLFHVRNIENTRERAKAAWDFVHFIAKVQEVQSGPFEGYLKRIIAESKKLVDPLAYFYHEYLEIENHSLMLVDFVAKARTAGLDYVGEACPRNTTLAGIDPGLANVISRFSNDSIEQEQYIDLALETGFRRAILCRSDQNLQRTSSPVFQGDWYASCSGSSSESGDDGSRSFSIKGRRTYRTSDPSTIHVLDILTNRWPASCTLKELQNGLVAPEGSSVEQELHEVLWSLHLDEIISLHKYRFPVATEITAKPKMTCNARLGAKQGQYVSSIQHSGVSLDDPVASIVLSHLDGNHDRAALINILLQASREGKIGIQVQDSPLHDLPNADQVAGQIVEEELTKARDLGMLLAE